MFFIVRKHQPLCYSDKMTKNLSLQNVLFKYMNILEILHGVLKVLGGFLKLCNFEVFLAAKCPPKHLGEKFLPDRSIMHVCQREPGGLMVYASQVTDTRL